MLVLGLFALSSHALAAEVTITKTTTPTSGGADTSTYKSNAAVTVSGEAKGTTKTVIVYFKSNTTLTQQADVKDGKWSVQINAPIVNANKNDTLVAEDKVNSTVSDDKSVTITK